MRREHSSVTADELTGNAERASELFDAEYYRAGCGPIPYERNQTCWRDLFGSIAQELIRSLRPRRVLDAGCALGFLVEAFWDRGVEAYGFDVSRYAISQVRRDLQSFCYLYSLGEGIPPELRELGKFDLVTCIEVLEHMPEPDARSAVRHLTDVTDTILFSSSPSDLEEKTHFNVKPLMYWLQLFQEHHFSPDLEFDAGFIAPHAMMLRRRENQFSLDVLRTFAAVLTARQGTIQQQGQISEWKQRHSEIERDLTGLRQAHDRLSTEYAEQQAILNSLQQTATAHQAIVDRLEDAHRQLDSVKREHDALAGKYAEQQEILGSLQQTATAHEALVHQQMDSAKEERDALATKYAEQQTAFTTAQEAFIQRTAELENAHRQLDTAKIGLSLVQAECTALSNRQREWDRALQQIRQQDREVAMEEIQGVRQELHDTLTEFSTSHRTQLATVGVRLGRVEHHLTAIINSRIWRFLVRGGRVLLKISGRY